MRDLIILPSWLVVNPSPEPEVTEPFWSEWFSDSVDLHRESDEYCECGAHTKATPCLFPVDKPLSDAVKGCEHPDHPWYCGCPGLRREVTELRGIDCQCAMCLGGSN